MRGFKTIEEMNEWMIAKWNETVNKDDLVYHLGDFGLGRPKALSDVRKRLNGKIKLVMGNHDYQISKKKWLEFIGMDEVLDKYTLDEFDLTHLPHYDSCDTKDGSKRWLLCGHVHQHWRIKDKMLNVGVDVNNFAPVSLDDIKEEVKDNKSL